jgi:hypothetical protein
LLSLVLVSAAPASAQQVWPGRVQLGANGGGIFYFGNDTNGGVGGFKVGFEISVRLAEFRWGSVWLGAGLNYVGLPSTTDYPHDFQPWLFTKLTFEKRVRFRLVPFISLGVAGDVFRRQSPASTEIDSGAFVFRVAVGADYWFVKWFALGLESVVTVGPRFSPYSGGIYTDLYGTVDIVGALRFAF